MPPLNEHVGREARPVRTPNALPAVFFLLLALTATARPQTVDCQAPEADKLSGAYRTAEGAVISILPVGVEGRRRITHFSSGRSHLLFPDGALEFHSAGDFDSPQPIVYRYAFRLGSGGVADSLVITGLASSPVIARRIPLVDRPASFKSGDVELRGRLTLPPKADRSSRAVIFVHGSDPTPSVGYEWLPHLLAANGIATLVFDKRGTGCSKGQYVQHFEVLAGDVVAAVRWLTTQSEIDAGQIGLAGFSQGGWVAPLAALKSPAVKFVAIGYGLAMSVADEDRLEAPLKLREQGVDEASIEEFKALNASLHELARSGFRDWSSFEEHLERVKNRPWFEVASRQQNWLGATLQMGLTKAKDVAPQMFQHFFQPFYDPVPTLEKLNIPMLWLMGGKDIEAPPEPTLKVLTRLRSQGKAVSVVVFPNADHGIQDFEVRDSKRVKTKYADRYFSTLLSWISNPS